jgi:hypothetical protein
VSSSFYAYLTFHLAQQLIRSKFFLSTGKKSLMAGFSKLYAFVKALEMDYSLAMCVVAI